MIELGFPVVALHPLVVRRRVGRADVAQESPNRKGGRTWQQDMVFGHAYIVHPQSPENGMPVASLARPGAIHASPPLTPIPYRLKSAQTARSQARADRRRRVRSLLLRAALADL